MAGVTVEITGLDQLRTNLARVGKSMESELSRAAKDGMVIYVEAPAKRNTPIDTGRLRNSIVTVGDSKAVATGTNVEYAPHQEFGTSKMKAHPYLRPAFDEGKDKVVKHIGDELAKAARV